MPLVQLEYHVLVSALNFAQSFQDLNNNVRCVFIVLQGQANDFLRADHIELVYASLAHFSL